MYGMSNVRLEMMSDRYLVKICERIFVGLRITLDVPEHLVAQRTLGKTYSRGIALKVREQV